MSKIVVIGGTGLIGSKLVATLSAHGHEAVPASPASGVDTLTGEGLAAVLDGAEVVVDVSNSPSFDDQAVLDFFTASTTNLIAAAKAAGVGHYVALSVVGTERLPESGYFRAKVAQERLISGSGIPFSLVHATQFFEFVKSIADAATHDGVVRLSPARVQPIAGDDVATALARVTVGAPLEGTHEVAGPQTFGLDEFVRTGLRLRGDDRPVVTDPAARYFGEVLGEQTLLPAADAEIAHTSYTDWFPSNNPTAAAASRPAAS